MPSQSNPEKLYLGTALVVTFLSAGLFFLPGLVHLDGMHGGYAISFIAFFIAICAAVIAIFFGGRSAALDRLLQGQGLLAHWTYSPVEWERFARLEWKELAADNKTLFWVVAIFASFFGVLFWLFDHEAGGIVFMVMLALIVVVALAALGLPRLWLARHRRGPAEAWFSAKAIFFHGDFVRWDYWKTALEQVEYRPANDEVSALLCFHLSAPSRSGRQVQTQRIPIPQGCEADAYRLLEQYT